jgi:hypothetical protein
VDRKLLAAAKLVIKKGVYLGNKGFDPITQTNYTFPYKLKVIIGAAGVSGTTFVDNAEYRKQVFKTYNAQVQLMCMCPCQHLATCRCSVGSFHSRTLLSVRLAMSRTVSVIHSVFSQRVIGVDRACHRGACHSTEGAAAPGRHQALYIVFPLCRAHVFVQQLPSSVHLRLLRHF